MTQPTTMRGSMVGPASDARLHAGAGAAGAGAGRGPALAASRSIALISASASALRPLDSSQRGDSGSALRRYQTTKAPTPAMTNISRQPRPGSRIARYPELSLAAAAPQALTLGMIRVPSRTVTGRPETTMNAIKASQRPRTRGGTNSVRVE